MERSGPSGDARADLGTWPKRQADAIATVLRHDRIALERRNTSAGVHLTVGSADEERANSAIAAAMDDIAAAADAPVVPIEKGRERRAQRKARDPSQRPLVAERFRRLTPLVVLLIGLLVALNIQAGAFRTAVVVIAIIATGVVVSERGRGSGSDGTYGS